jgi:hypothetical protein
MQEHACYFGHKNLKKKKKTKKQKRTYTPKYVAKISKEREATKLE